MWMVPKQQFSLYPSVEVPSTLVRYWKGGVKTLLIGHSKQPDVSSSALWCRISQTPSLLSGKASFLVINNNTCMLSVEIVWSSKRERAAETRWWMRAEQRKKGHQLVCAVSPAVMYRAGHNVSVNSSGSISRIKTSLPWWFPTAGNVKAVILQPAMNNQTYI